MSEGVPASRSLLGEEIVGCGSTGEFEWRKAKRCADGSCVEVGALGESVLIRNTADPDGPHVTLARDEWQVFVAGVKDGDFDSL